MKKEEERLQKEKKRQWDESKKEKLRMMLLFMTCDRSDDGYIQMREWMQLKGCIVLNDKHTANINRKIKTALASSVKGISKRSQIIKRGSSSAQRVVEPLNTQND